jgi:hypothetical protein
LKLHAQENGTRLADVTSPSIMKERGMHSHSIRGLAAAAFVALGLASSAQASIIGDSIRIDYAFPTAGSVIESQTITVATSPTSTPVEFGDLTAVFTTSQITLLDSPGCGPGCFQSPGAFNGLIFTDLTHPFTMLNVDPSTNYSDFTAFLSGGSIFVSRPNHVIVPGDRLVLDLRPIPEPLTLAIMGASLAGLAGLRRKKKAA